MIEESNGIADSRVSNPGFLSYAPVCSSVYYAVRMTGNCVSKKQILNERLFPAKLFYTPGWLSGRAASQSS